MTDFIRALESRGYLVLRFAPGQVFDLIGLPNAHTDRIAPGWVARANPTSGFDVDEAAAIAHDRGGKHLRDEDVMR